jgi:branched-chain amino acid transport system ATP-binding protein
VPPADLAPGEGVPLLELRGIRAGYGKGEVLHGVGLTLEEGGLLAVLGPNGAGKSTLLKTVAGIVPPTRGSVLLRGRPLAGHRPSEVARCGVYLVREGRAIFPSLSVRENLRMATGRPERQWMSRLDETLDAFPRLRERLDQRVGTMSGGEQQMVSLARAWVARPLLLLLDEPSLGLAPLVIDEVFEAIARFRAEGVSVLLVEQYVHRALQVADRAAVLNKGEIVFLGAPDDLEASDLAARYLGTAATV